MKNPKSSRNDSLRKYAYFSGVGFQMLAIIGVFTYIGYRIDISQDTGTIWTALLAVMGVSISIYTVIRAVTRKDR